MSDATADSSNPKVILNLGDNGGDVEVQTLSDANKWIDTERTYWKWMKETKGFAAPQVVDQYEMVFKKLESLLAKTENQENSEQEAKATDQFVGHLRKQYNPEKPAVFHSTSDVAKRIEQVREREGNEIAAQVVAFGIGIPCDHQPPRNWLPGAFEQIAFDRGIDSSIIERKQLDELRREFTDALNECKKTADEDHSAALVQLEEAETSLHALDQHYREKIKFKEAVSYWDTKKDTHDTASRYWGMASVGVLAAGLIAVLIYWCCSATPADTLKQLEKSYAEVPASVILGTILHSSIRFALFMLGIIWLGRIVVRNYLSHTHLATDAAERAVVIQTYLSLIADPEVVENKEHHDQMLEHALKRIFWHAQTGIVKDDAMPDVALIAAATGRSQS